MTSIPNCSFPTPLTLFSDNRYSKDKSAYELLPNQEAKKRLKATLKNLGINNVEDAKETDIGTGKNAAQVNKLLRVVNDDPALQAMLAKLEKEGYKIEIVKGDDGAYTIDRGNKVLKVQMGEAFEGYGNPAPADLIGLVAGISHAAYQSDMLDSQAVPLLTDGAFLKGNMTFATNKSKVLLRNFGSNLGTKKLDTLADTQKVATELANNQLGSKASLNGQEDYRSELQKIGAKFGVTLVGPAKSQEEVFGRTEAIEAEFATLEQELKTVGNATTSRALEDRVTGATSPLSDKEIAEKKQAVLQKMEGLLKELEGLNTNAATQVNNRSTSFGVETASKVDSTLTDLKKRLAEAKKQNPTLGITNGVELVPDKQKVEAFNKSVASLTQRFDSAYANRHSGGKIDIERAKDMRMEALNDLNTLIKEAEANNKIPTADLESAKKALEKRREQLRAL
jgi:hypothetical protein